MAKTTLLDHLIAAHLFDEVRSERVSIHIDCLPALNLRGIDATIRPNDAHGGDGGIDRHHQRLPGRDLRRLQTAPPAPDSR